MLEKHVGDEEVMSAVTDCLSALASDPYYAAKLAQSGVVVGLIKSVTANPDAEAAVDTLALMGVVSENNADALVLAGGAAAVSELLDAGLKKSHVLEAAVHAVECISRAKGGTDALMETSTLQKIVAVVDADADDDEDVGDGGHLAHSGAASDSSSAAASATRHQQRRARKAAAASAMRVLDRSVRNEAAANVVREAGGLRVIAAALSRQSDKSSVDAGQSSLRSESNPSISATQKTSSNSSTEKAASRIMTRLAKGNVASVVQQMKDATSVKEQLVLSSMLGTLALEEDNVEEIVREGAVSALVSTLSSGGEAAATHGAARALERIASTAGGAAQLVRDGGVDALVSALSTCKDDAATAAEVTATVLHLAGTEEALPAIVEKGGVKSIVAMLKEHPDAPVQATQALKFIEGLATVDCELDLAEVVDLGVIPAAVNAMISPLAGDATRLAGTRALICVCDSEVRLRDAAASGVLPQLVASLRETTSAEFAAATLYLLGTFALVEEHRESLAALDATGALVAAMSRLGGSTVVSSAARDFVETMVDVVPAVEASVAAVAAALAEAAPQAAAETFVKLESAVVGIGALSCTLSLACAMTRLGAVKAVADAVVFARSADDGGGSDLAESAAAVIAAGAESLHRVLNAAPDSDVLRFMHFSHGAVFGVIKAIKSQPKRTRGVSACLRYLLAYADAADESCAAVPKLGGVEACATAMRANSGDHALLRDAAQLLCSVARLPSGASAVVRRGGSREVITALTGIPRPSQYAECAQAMLRVLDQILAADDDAIADVVSKQGAVDAVIAASEAQAGRLEVSTIAGVVLEQLFARSDVSSVVSSLVELVTSTSEVTAEPVKVALQRLAQVALAPASAELLVHDSGVDSLVELCSRLLEARTESKVANGLLAEAVQCIANVSQHCVGSITPDHGLAPTVAAVLAAKEALPQCVEVVARLSHRVDNAESFCRGTPSSVAGVVAAARLAGSNISLAESSFNALSGVAAASEECAAATVAAEAGTVATEWLDDNVDHAPLGQLVAPLKLLGLLAERVPAFAAELTSRGVDTTRAVLSRLIDDGRNDEYDAVVLGACLALLVSMAQADGAAGLDAVCASGVLKRVVRVLSCSVGYTESASCVALFATLVLLGCDGGKGPDFMDVGADDTLVAGMSANSTDDVLVTKCGAALSALGAGAEAVAAALDEVESMSSLLSESGSLDAASTTALGDAVTRLTTLSAIDGVVTSDNAPRILEALQSSVGNLGAAAEASAQGGASNVRRHVQTVSVPRGQPGRSAASAEGAAVAAAIAGIGRVVSLELVSEEQVSTAVGSVADVLVSAVDDEEIQASAVHSLGAMACGETAVRVMAERGCLAAVTSAARARSADARLQAVTARTISKIAGATAKHATSLVSATTSHPSGVETGAGAADDLSVPQGTRSHAAEHICDVVEAAMSAGDDSAATAVVDTVAAAEGGDSVLWDILDVAESISATSSVLAALSTRNAPEGEEARPVVATKPRVAGLVHAMAASRSVTTAAHVAHSSRSAARSSAVARLASRSDSASVFRTATDSTRVMPAATSDSTNSGPSVLMEAAAAKTLSASVSLLAQMEIDEGAAGVIVEEGGTEQLLEVVAAESGNEETTGHAVAVLEKVAAVSSSAVAKLASSREAIGSILKVTQAGFATGTEVCNAFKLLDHVVSASDVQRAVATGAVSRDTFKFVQVTAGSWSGDDDVSAVAATLMAKLGDLFSDAPGNLLLESLNETAALLASNGEVVFTTDESGDSFYFDQSSGESVWDRPQHYQDMVDSCNRLVSNASGVDENALPEIAAETIGAIAWGMSIHATSNEIIPALAPVLKKVCLVDANLNAFYEGGGVPTLLATIPAHTEVTQPLADLCTVLTQLCERKEWRVPAREGGALEVVCPVLQSWATWAADNNVLDADTAVIVKTLLRTVTLLTHGSVEFATAAINAAAVPSIEAAFRCHALDSKVAALALATAATLVAGSDENKISVCNGAGSSIVSALAGHAGEYSIARPAMQLMGSLSAVDENIRTLVVTHRASKAIASVLRSSAGASHPTLLTLCCDVLSAFGAFEADEDEDDSAESVEVAICEDGATSALIDTLLGKFSGDRDVVSSALDALNNVADNIDVSDKMATEQGLAAALQRAVNSFDYDGEIVGSALGVIAAVTFAPRAAAAFATTDAVTMLLNAVDSHQQDDDAELVLNALGGLANIVAVPAAQAVVANMDGSRTVVAMLSAHSRDRDLCLRVMQLLVAMCGDAELSASIASDGMHVVVRVIELYAADWEFLAESFRLLAHIALLEENIVAIVQHGGIQHVIRAIATHPDKRDLILRCVQTLDNIAMANREHAAIVVDDGAEAVLDGISEAYASDPDVSAACKAAQLTISVQASLSTHSREKIGGKAGGAGAADVAAARATEATVDPLADVRHFLQAGSIVSLWDKGSSRSVHLCLSRDMLSMKWSDPRTKKRLGGIDLRSIAIVEPGMKEGHKRRAISRQSKCEPDCAFSVTVNSADRQAYCFETSSPPYVSKWCGALVKLLEVFKTSPESL